ncbi:MAG: prepilin peptidase [candidate division WOR-3 bacterium]
MVFLIAFFSFLFGLVIGSFLNVLIYRLPKNISLIKPGSHCPTCGMSIKFYDNIPIVSYLILKGKCRNCGTRISPIYPLVEGITGFLFLIFYLKFRFPVSLKYMLLTSLLIPISFIDAKEKLIPDVLTIPWIAIGLLLTMLFKDLPALQVLITTLVSGFLFWALRFIFSRILKREALGEGDIILIMLISSYTGLWGAYLAMLLGSLTALLVHFLFPEKIKGEIPFGPFLSFGAIIGALTL